MYVAYAMKAMEEGHPEVADVFLQVSGSETIHAIEHLKALGDVHGTLQNLRKVIEDEMREASEMYPRMIRQAEEEGRADAARTFRLAFDGESRHAELFEQTYTSLRSAQPRASGAMVPTPPVPIVPQAIETSPIPEDLDSEKRRVAGLRRIREVVFGAQDALISIVAIAATVMAASGQAHLAIVAGLAAALAGTVSMAAGTYLGSRATTEMEEAEIEGERRELARDPDEELAELVHTFRRDGYSLTEAEQMADRLMEDLPMALRVMTERELGISPEALPDPGKDAGVMAASFGIGGLVPLLPYFFSAGVVSIAASVVLTLVALGAVGVIKARIAHRPLVRSVLEILGVGALSGALGFALGEYIPRLFGLS